MKASKFAEFCPNECALFSLPTVAGTGAAIKNPTPPSFSLQAIVAFIIDDDHWTLDLRPGKGFLVPGPPHGKDPADVVLKMSDATFVNLVMGKIASETAWLLRKIKISGSMLVAWRLDPVLDAAAAKLQA